MQYYFNNPLVNFIILFFYLNFINGWHGDWHRFNLNRWQGYCFNINGWHGDDLFNAIINDLFDLVFGFKFVYDC